jgi:hypothetical protein
VTPFGVSVVVQLQLIALQVALVAGVHAQPQSLFQGEMVLD